MGQTRTLRNKMNPVYRTFLDEDGKPQSEKVPRSGALDAFNSKREDLSKRGQMLQRHPTKGDRGISIRRARAAQIEVAIMRGQPGAGNTETMRRHMTNLDEVTY